jgi:hypothetical protein
MKNALIDLINAGRIRSLEDLKSTYHKIVMKTHPDAVGSEKLLTKYLSFAGQYEEAKQYLLGLSKVTQEPKKKAATNHRMEFFVQLSSIEAFETLNKTTPGRITPHLVAAKKAARVELSEWRPDLLDLYDKAVREYDRIKYEHATGLRTRHPPTLVVPPLLKNIIAFHLSGKALYLVRARKNHALALYRLIEKSSFHLHGFLSFLVDDLKNGSATTNLSHIVEELAAKSKKR